MMTWRRKRRGREPRLGVGWEPEFLFHVLRWIRPGAEGVRLGEASSHIQFGLGGRGASMEGQEFDELTKKLAKPVSRRTVFKAAVATAGGAGASSDQVRFGFATVREDAVLQ
jgi:hypothetical protein